MHEGFPAQLMLALYRSGRRLEALEVYRSLRQRLVSELGGWSRRVNWPGCTGRCWAATSR
ncbi:hypothetical protein GCM10020000_67220 [Streptomyces olivoverticillatus]